MKIVAIGDIGVDHYVNKGLNKPGGIALNFAFNSFKSGATASIVSVIGNDSNGRKVKHLLHGTKLNISHIHTDSGETPLQKIILESGGERKFIGYTPGVLSNWKLEKTDLNFISKHDAIFVPFSDGMKQIVEKIRKLKTEAVKVIDFSQDSEYSDFEKKDNIITNYCPFFDINFVGATQEQIPLLNALSKRYKEKVFILTLGKKGSICFINGEQYIQPTKEVKKVVDTTGAGDAFQAKFLSVYLETKNIKESLKKATIYAGRIISFIGSTNLTFNSGLS